MKGGTETSKLYAQGVVLGDASHDQRSWTERLRAEMPPECAVAAGVLASHAASGNVQFASYLAFELYNAGCLRMPEGLPEWKEVSPGDQV